jgi:hypothetical protein
VLDQATVHCALHGFAELQWLRRRLSRTRHVLPPLKATKDPFLVSLPFHRTIPSCDPLSLAILAGMSSRSTSHEHQPANPNCAFDS